MIEDDRNSRFSEVVLPHLPDALTTALWLPGNRTDAEDVVQEACLRAFRLIARECIISAKDELDHSLRTTTSNHSQ
jgi:DNA-directed RNA polymerase specialized sigma24 family protein